MPVTLKPNDGMREHVTNFRLTDKPAGEFTSSSGKYAKYIPSKEEIIQIATLIEKYTGMKVDEKLKQGELKIKFVSMKMAQEMEERDILSAIDRLNFEPPIRDTLRNFIKKHHDKKKAFTRENSAYFDAEHNTIYLIPENIEKLAKKGAMIFIKMGFVEGRIERHFFRETADKEAIKNVEKFIVLYTLAHELIHKTVAENNPEVGYSYIRGEANELKFLAEIEKAKTRPDSERVKPIYHSIRMNRNKAITLNNYDEAIAYYAGHRLMREMGYSPQADQLEQTTMLEAQYAKGIAFLEEIRKATNKNPVAFTIRDPPQSMQEIEDYKVYLRRVKGWKI